MDTAGEIEAERTPFLHFKSVREIGATPEPGEGIAALSASAQCLHLQSNPEIWATELFEAAYS